jgi:Xaa-Pro aminopeptidase
MHDEEKVGPDFSLEKLARARAATWRVVQAIAQAVRPGHGQEDVRCLLVQAMASENIEKSWHPPQLRLGPSTCCPFGAPARSDAPLAENDIYFIDLGLIVAEHEGDCGQTFVLGDDEDMKRCAADAERVHREGVAFWRESRCSGHGLYQWTRARATALGWTLALTKADGHRIGDLPHHRFFKGNLADRDYTPAADRWIYEVQLIDPAGRFGAFYEDLLVIT